MKNYTCLILTSFICLISLNIHAQNQYNISTPYGLQYDFNIQCYGITRSVYASAILVQPSTSTSFLTVCADIGGVLYVPQTGTFTSTPFTSTLNGLDPGWSSSNSLNRAAYVIYFGEPWAGNDSEKWAAVQLAVWDCLYNTNPNGTQSTNFTILSGNNEVLADYDSLIQYEYSCPVNEYFGALLIPKDITSQELFEYVSKPVATPEPTTIAFLVMLGALFLIAARHSNKHPKQ